MQNQKSEQQDQCFLKDQYDMIEKNYLDSEINCDVSFNIPKFLPANQLRSARRPQHFFPRTFYNSRDIYLLPQQLDLSCIQQITKDYSQGINRIRIGNKEKLGIQDYFSKKDFICIYNRLSKCKQGQKTFMGQIKSTLNGSDYNYKMYKQLQQQIYLLEQNQKDAIDADFQCGNICKVYTPKNNPSDNYLIIQNDINTHGYNNWFFFRYRNIKTGTRTFNIVNFIKKTENYRKGMKISIFSRKKHMFQKTFWQKGGNKINFGQTNFSRIYHENENYFYLSFQYEFKYEFDQVYFCLNQPYTYSRMIRHMQLLKELKLNSTIDIQQQIAGYSISNNIIPLLKIKSKNVQQKKLQTILITARQHPCQTVGSFLCQSIIDTIFNASKQVENLLQKFQFVIVPMVNPDGVIHGSSRCNLAGFDLNRQWHDYSIKELTPEIQKLKKIINQINLANPIKYAFDLHGHGKKLNSFLFSCKKQQKTTNRILQLSLNKLQQRFNIFDCTYGIDKDKQNTIRSQLYQLGVSHVYTIQNSLYGYMKKNGQIHHYNESDFKFIAESLIKSILIFNQDSKISQQILGFSKQSLLQNNSLLEKIIQKQEENKKNLFDNASDSDPDGDILNIQERIQTYKNNKNLQKKIKDETKIKKLKNNKKFEYKIKQKQYQVKLSDSCPATNYFQDQFQEEQKKNNQNLSERNKQIGKIVLKNKKNVIYNHRRIKQKRQSLNQTKIKLNQKSKQNQTFFFNENMVLHKKQVKISLKRSNYSALKRKTCSSVIYQYPSTLILAQKRNQRIKTQESKNQCSQQKKIEQIKIQHLQTQPILNQNKEIQKQSKFSQLKQQSLKSLLTDTFSILKLDSKYSIKGSRGIRKQIKSKNQKCNFQTKSLRSNSQNKKLKVLNKANLSQRNQKQIVNQQLLKTKQSGKYQRFQNFIKQTGKSYKNILQKNSVFYYFPVL